MKANNKVNKIVILSIIALIFTISLVIFILNYTKDSSSFSIIEKNWISSNANKVIDVSIYNDVPVYGQDGEGIAFAYLDKFTEAYNIEFNKVSYLTTGKTDLRNVAFRIANFDDALTDNDIEIYRDYYVIVGKNTDTVNDIKDLKGKKLGVLDEDINNVRYYLNDGKDIIITTSASFEEMYNLFVGGEIEYMAIPQNLYLDDIFKNDLAIVYHISEVYKKYIITVTNDKTLKSIMNKFNIIYNNNYEQDDYKKYFLSTFFKYNDVSEAERMNYNSSAYTYGYVINMPFESMVNKEFVGTISNYLTGFEDLTDVDFKLNLYDNVLELKQALSHGEIDFIFGNFNVEGVNVDVLKTASPFKEEYVVLSKEPILVNSIRSLKGQDIYTISNTYLFDYLSQNAIAPKAFNNTDMLLHNIRSESIVMVDRDTYEYYKDNKFKNYKIIYQDTLNNDYNFIVRDVNKNETFYKLFNYYVASVNYKTIKYNYNTDYVVSSKSGLGNMLKFLAIVLSITVVLIGLLLLVLRLRGKKKSISKEDKMKFIDAMTSLKNRNYLNYSIKSWDDNVIYPQSIIIIDLNNIKYINDNYGHAEGDEVIKRAAAILINSEQQNTDIVRTDGNEFLIYTVGYDEKQVIEYTRKINKDLKELPHGFGATLGYSMINDDIKTIDDAINEATLSMRQAKEKI